MPISPYGHNDQGSPEEWAAYHASEKRREARRVELEALQKEFALSSLGDRPPSMSAKKLRRLIELEREEK